MRLIVSSISLFAIPVLLITVTAQNVSVRKFDRSIELAESGFTSSYVSAGDVDGDGDMDLLLSTGRHWDALLRVYPNDGKGGFSTSTPLGSQGFPSYGAPLVDLNRDNSLDVAIGTDRPAEKPVFLNDGKGVFRRAGSFGDAQMITRNISIADLNGDRFPDIAVANRGGGNFVFINDGKAGFARAVTVGTAADHTVTIAIADVDNDRRPDLLLANRDGQQCAVYRNEGEGRFVYFKPIGPANADTRAIAAGDLNGDGFSDVLASHLGLETVVYFNDGKGGFASSLTLEKNPRITPGTDAGSYSITIADLNRDGKADIVLGRVGANSVFFNLGAGRAFREVPFGESMAVTYQMAIADLNADGFPDIVTATSGALSRVYFSTPE
jgi:hypothetical protein